MYSVNQIPHLTKEEQDELKKLWEDYLAARNATVSAADNWGKYNNSDWYYDYNEPPRFKRTPHEWVAVLLLNHTVYDCKHCGTKQEKAKGVYCEDETEF